MVNEHSIKNSFRYVKKDILQLQGEILNLQAQQVRILEELEKLSSKTATTKKKSKKKTSKRR